MIVRSKNGDLPEVAADVFVEVNVTRFWPSWDTFTVISEKSSSLPCLVPARRTMRDNMNDIKPNTIGMTANGRMWDMMFVIEKVFRPTSCSWVR